jgi:YgiT-type zinc finger domain-containing protein
MGSRIQAQEVAMKCVICKTGDVRPAEVQAEMKVGSDRLLIPVEGEMCQECGEAYYSADVLRYLERVREDFSRKVISPPSVGVVYQLS